MASLARQQVQRTSWTLPVTTKVSPFGAPIAPRLNFYAKAAGHSEEHGEASVRTEFKQIPKWASSQDIGPQGLTIKTAYTSVPNASFQKRFAHTSASPATRASTVAGPPLDSNPYTPHVPDYSKYTKQSESTGRSVSYFMVGSLGLLTAAGAKSTVSDFIANLTASADVLALAKVEVDLTSIPEGKNVIIKWRGKPVFIRHRTEEDIKNARAVDVKSLRDPQSDEDRVQKPEWLIMLGVCTHLGCVPIGEAGDFGGWFCPCHGSHYDGSGRIRKGPAPLNLEVPEYSFPEDGKLIVG